MATGMVKQRPAGAHAAIVAQVREEAAHLPGPAPAWYGQLRRLYWLKRMESLGRKRQRVLSPLEVLLDALDDMGLDFSDLNEREREWWRQQAPEEES